MNAKPLIIAHRGARTKAPENTIKAFKIAAHEGADGIEFDVVPTKDNQLVVFHDVNLKRMTGIDKKINQMTLSELKKIKIEGEEIPTLDELFSEVGPLFKILNLEIKFVNTFNHHAKKTYETICQYNMNSKVVVSCFNPFYLLCFKNYDPQIKKGLLLCHENSMAHFNFWPQFLNTTSIHLEEKWGRLNQKNYLNYNHWIWTVNQLPDFDFWIQNKAFAIITDFPDLLKKHIDSLSD